MCVDGALGGDVVMMTVLTHTMQPHSHTPQQHKSHLTTSMFEFVGRLVGMSLRWNSTMVRAHVPLLLLLLLLLAATVNIIITYMLTRTPSGVRVPFARVAQAAGATAKPGGLASHGHAGSADTVCHSSL